MRPGRALRRLSAATWALAGLLLLIVVGWTLTFFGCPQWWPASTTRSMQHVVFSPRASVDCWPQLSLEQGCRRFMDTMTGRRFTVCEEMAGP
jgi:hypothetical protein